MQEHDAKSDPTSKVINKPCASPSNNKSWPEANNHPVWDFRGLREPNIYFLLDFNTLSIQTKLALLKQKGLKGK